MNEVGPSRFPAVHPTTRHHPYPQSRPQRQGPYTTFSPVDGHVGGKGREVPSTAMGHGLPTPNTSPPVAPLKVFPLMLECCASTNTFRKRTTLTIRPHGEASVQSPFRSSTVPRRSGSPLVVTGTPELAQVTQVPQHLTEADNFYWSASAQGSWSNSTQMHDGSMGQLQTIPTGSRGPGIWSPTLPMGINPLLGAPPLETQHQASPRSVEQNLSLKPLSSPVARRLPPRRAVQQSAPHPYARPANVRK